VRPSDPDDFSPEWMGQREPKTTQDLCDALEELRLLAIRLNQRTVGAVIASAIGLIRHTTH
jgi:hypothetical protein